MAPPRLDLDAVERELDQPWAEYVPHIHKLGHQLLAEIRAARKTLQLVHSVASEDSVRETLLCYIQGCELLRELASGEAGDVD